jgi:4-hydroxybenzoate polyprenyltransferase
MNALKTHWELARGGNALITALAVWVGGSVGAITFDVRLALLGGLAAALAAASGNIVNDIYDRDMDARNKGHRPIPSGRISLTSAWLDAALAATAAAVCAHLINHLSFLILCATLLALWLYSWKLKGWFGVGHLVVSLLAGLSFLILCATLLALWLYSWKLKGWFGVGHIVVSLLAGLSLLFGAVVQGETLSSVLIQGWIAFAFAALWHLAREWAKAAEDLEEDRVAGVQTLAVWLGETVACRAAAVTLMAILLSLWWPFAAGYFGLEYLLFVLAAVAPVLAGSAYTLWFVPDKAKLDSVTRLLKWDMLVGVAAIWFG